MLILPLQNALLFAIETIFDVYVSIVLFRLILQLVRADFYNPLAQFAVKASNPILIPARKIIPGFAGVDCAAIVIALLLVAAKLTILQLIRGFTVAPTLVAVSGLFIWTVGDSLNLLLTILFWATIIQAIFSWLQPGQYNPNIILFSQITNPLCRPVRKIMPDLGVIDFSPMIVIFFIVLAQRLLENYIVPLGRGLT